MEPDELEDQMATLQLLACIDFSERRGRPMKLDSAHITFFLVEIAANGEIWSVAGDDSPAAAAFDAAVAATVAEELRSVDTEELRAECRDAIDRGVEAGFLFLDGERLTLTARGRAEIAAFKQMKGAQ